MGLFGKKTPPPPPPSEPEGPSITDGDKEWVERAFKFIISIFGFPSENTTQIDFSKQHFPKTFNGKKIEVASLIADLCDYLSLDIKRITFEFGKDIRDISQTPYQIYGNAFQSELEIVADPNVGKRYYIRIANDLGENPDVLVIRTIVELLKVKFAENDNSFTIEDDSNLFIYLLGIYFGLGCILASNLYDVRTERAGGWTRRSKFDSGVPPQVMAYALAIFAKTLNVDNPEWINPLPEQIREEFNLSIEYLSGIDLDLLNEEEPDNEFVEGEISKHATTLYRNNHFERAILELLKTIPLTDNSSRLASRYCNLGYYSLRLKQYEESIPYFLKSLENKSDHGYSLDNLGFAYLMTNRLEEGKESIEKAMATRSNDASYSLRNLGIYYMKKDELEKAEEYFKKAFDMHRKVDLLEYFYAQFLFQKGNKKEGMRYLEIAVEKGEPEAVELIEELADSSPTE